MSSCLQADLEVLIGNLLDVWASIDPRRIIDKVKLHTLVHLPEDIRNHGPAVLYSTEIFECWNAIFRMCSILSNHHSPSHDIAESLADLERFKHQVSGGWWKNSRGEFVRSGSGVRSFLRSNKELQRRLGWVEQVSISPGMSSCSCLPNESIDTSFRVCEIGACQTKDRGRIRQAHPSTVGVYRSG